MLINVIKPASIVFFTFISIIPANFYLCNFYGGPRWLKWVRGSSPFQFNHIFCTCEMR